MRIKNEFIRTDRKPGGIERLEAHFLRQGYSPHRHDTYAIGVTLSGVQVFRYRGGQRYCLPSQCHILHPDELHDGNPATESGFSYRILYIDPSLVQQALGSRQLPFIANPVIDLAPDDLRVLSRLCDLNEEMDEWGQVETATFVAEMLARLARSDWARQEAVPVDLLKRVRDAIAATPNVRQPMEDLEHIAGIDRWALARQFRAAFGTSPRRFRTMRQLDTVRRLVKGGISLVDASVEAGFADQSHMARMFKRAYGLTPARWAAAINHTQP